MSSTCSSKDFCGSTERFSSFSTSFVFGGGVAVGAGVGIPEVVIPAGGEGMATEAV